MLKMLKLLREFGGLLRGNPQENFNIFNMSPISSTFLEKGVQTKRMLKMLKL